MDNDQPSWIEQQRTFRIITEDKELNLLLKDFHNLFNKCLEKAYEVTGYDMEGDSIYYENVHDMLREYIIESLSWFWG